ncbi:MAG: glycosyltransferase family 39 protein, partial [Planctomycetia bacterium]|nr:glycosyltransferase family 39 protein [Planctomycetia bacterium]
MPTENGSRPESARAGRTWLVAAVALAAFIQIVVVVRSPAICNDGITFIGIAKALMRSPAAAMREADQHPGYPAMTLVGRYVVRGFVGGDEVLSWILGARLVSGACGLLSVVAVWLLARRTFDERVAGVSAIIFAVLPLFRENAADAMSDTPHLLFYLLAVWLVAEGFVRRRFFWFPLAGAASGLAYWIRPEGLSVALVTGGLLGLWVLRRDRRRLAVSCLAGLLLTAGIVAMPYVCIKGKFTSKKDITSLVRRNTGPESSDRTQAASQAVARQVPEPSMKPAQDFSALVLFRGAWELVHEFFHGIRYFLAVPFAIGLFLPRSLRAQRELRVLLGALGGFHIVLLFVLYLMAEYISSRHIMQLVCLAMPWTASGMIYIAGRISTVMPRAVATRLRPERMLILLVALVVVGLFPRSLRPLHRHRIGLVKAACWVRAHAAEGDSVLTNSVYVPFYADMPGRIITKDDAIPEPPGRDGVLPYRFLVFDKGSEDFREDWLPLLA